MYFKKITLQESVKFTIKNLVDMLTIPSHDPVEMAEEKLRRIRDEFFKYYDFSNTTERQLLDKIETMADKSNGPEPLDIEKLERFHHLHLRFKLMGEGTPLSNTDFIRFYTLFFRSFFAFQLPSQMTKYTLPRFIGGKYLIFITFDEKKISNVHLLTADNQLDLRSLIYLTPLTLNYAVFKQKY